MTRPRLARAAMDAIHTRALREHAALEEEALIDRITKRGALVDLALATYAGRSPDTDPRLSELQARLDALNGECG